MLMFFFLNIYFCFFLNFVYDGSGCVHINADTHRSEMRTLYLLELELQTEASCTECILELFPGPLQQQYMLLTTEIVLQLQSQNSLPSPSMSYV